MTTPPIPHDELHDSPRDVTAGSEPVEALEIARRRRFYERLMASKGKIRLEIDLDELRGRNRS